MDNLGELAAGLLETLIQYASLIFLKFLFQPSFPGLPVYFSPGGNSWKEIWRTQGQKLALSLYFSKAVVTSTIQHDAVTTLQHVNFFDSS